MKLDYRPLFDVGEGKPIILLHGLFGNLSSWGHVAYEFTSNHRVIVPRLPFHSHVIIGHSLDQLVDYIEAFIGNLNLGKVILIGNSLGGHVALLYAWRHPDRVIKLVLSGSSGLHENTFGGTFPRVKDYEYIREKVQKNFYKPTVVTKKMVDEVYQIVQSPDKTISIIELARASQKHTVADLLADIKTPTLLIWGLQDNITPPDVALEFHQGLCNSEMIFLDHCGHVPMMEQPKLFNKHVRTFLEQNVN